MTTEADLIRAVLERPDDDTSGVLADWLEDQGRHDAGGLRLPGWWWLVPGSAPLRSLVWMRHGPDGDLTGGPCLTLDDQERLPLCDTCCGRPTVVSEQSGKWVCGGCYGHERRHDDD